MPTLQALSRLFRLSFDAGLVYTTYAKNVNTIGEGSCLVALFHALGSYCTETWISSSAPDTAWRALGTAVLERSRPGLLLASASPQDRAVGAIVLGQIVAVYLHSKVARLHRTRHHLRGVWAGVQARPDAAGSAPTWCARWSRFVGNLTREVVYHRASVWLARKAWTASLPGLAEGADDAWNLSHLVKAGLWVLWTGIAMVEMSVYDDWVTPLIWDIFWVGGLETWDSMTKHRCT